MTNHPYHLVDYRPWPLIGSIGGLTFVSGIIIIFHKYYFTLLWIGIFLLLLTIIQWWRDISREGTFLGLHTVMVVKGLKLGMLLFIVSEIFFFISFFWGFFHSRLRPVMEIGITWPPVGIYVFNPIQVPLLNTIILLCSGITITWSHHSIINSDHTSSIFGILLTVILGLYFTILQGYEYYEASFTIRDSIYGSSFFVATGFHGIHVIIGTTFIIVCLLRQIKFHFSANHHFGFEAAAWYWHFVDVVWLFLYLSIYWWGR